MAEIWTESMMPEFEENVLTWETANLIFDSAHPTHFPFSNRFLEVPLFYLRQSAFVHFKNTVAEYLYILG